MLKPYPVIEMTWKGWQELHPDALVLSDETGFDRPYNTDPLNIYRTPDNPELFWPMPVSIDRRRLPKERVLGIPDNFDGKSYPLEELDERSPARVVHDTLAGRPLVVFYKRSQDAALAFWTDGADAGRQFEAQEDRIVDAATGSEWNVEGLATAGALAGTRL